MRAIILAGGKATRLYPTTLIMPKQLVMINGYPVIHYVLQHCAINGIREATICISDRGIQREFVNALEGRYPQMTIDFSISPRSFGTAGRIQEALKKFSDGTYVAYYGDIITDFSLRDMIKRHQKDSRKPICTLALNGKKEIEFGLAKFETDSSRVSKFLEHPKISKISPFKVNVGISVCERRTSKFCLPGSDFYRDAIPAMISHGDFVLGYPIANFIDVGTFRSIEVAKKLLSNKSRT